MHQEKAKKVARHSQNYHNALKLLGKATTAPRREHLLTTLASNTAYAQALETEALSTGQSQRHALARAFARVSLGGQKDEHKCIHEAPLCWEGSETWPVNSATRKKGPSAGRAGPASPITRRPHKSSIPTASVSRDELLREVPDLLLE